MIQKLIFFLFVVILFSGCWRDPLPSKAIDRETFTNILVDVHLAEGMFQEKSRIEIDSLQSKSLYLSVLKKYKVSEERMEITTLYYSRHPKEYDKIFTEVLSKITSMTEELQGKKDDLKKK